MADHSNLNEMFVSSILKLHLLRQGYRVTAEERIDGKKYDLVFSKGGLSSSPTVAIDLKKYSASAYKKMLTSPHVSSNQGPRVEHHTVFIKSNQEVMTDRWLADLLGSDGDLKVTAYGVT